MSFITMFAYRFICVCAYKAERMTHTDYCFYFDADDKAKPVKLWGTMECRSTAPGVPGSAS